MRRPDLHIADAPLRGNTPQEIHAASLVVAQHATSHDDAAALLTTLGIIPTPVKAPPPKVVRARRARPLTSVYGYGPWRDQYGNIRQCRNGHDYTDENTRWRKAPKTPECRQCDRERRRRGKEQ